MSDVIDQLHDLCRQLNIPVPPPPPLPPKEVMDEQKRAQVLRDWVQGKYRPKPQPLDIYKPKATATYDPRADEEVQGVKRYMSSFVNLESRTRRVLLDILRRLLRKGRKSIKDLTKTQKICISVLFEPDLMEELGIQDGKELDCITPDGVEFDIKGTVNDNGRWAIPSEAYGKVGLVMRYSESDNLLWLGVLRFRIEILGEPNRDTKRIVSVDGERFVDWIFISEVQANRKEVA